MRSCVEVQEALADYIYDLPTQWESEEISAHLHTCRTCAEAYDRLTEQLGMLDAWEVPSPQGSGYADFLAALESRTAPQDETPAAVLSAALAGEDEVRAQGGLWRPRLWAPQALRTRVAASFGALAAAALIMALLVVPSARTAVAGRAEGERRRCVEVLIAHDQLAEAERLCSDWVVESPDSTTPRWLLSEVCQQRRDWAGARKQLEAVVSLAPMSVTAHLRLGDIARRQRRYTEAKGRYQRTLDIAGRYVESAYCGLASMALELEQTEEAREYADMALQASPGSPKVLALVGEVARLSGETAEARRRFREALRVDPRCADALYGMVALLLAAGDEPELSRMYATRFLAVECDTSRAASVRAQLRNVSLPQEHGGLASPLSQVPGSRRTGPARSTPAGERTLPTPGKRSGA